MLHYHYSQCAVNLTITYGPVKYYKNNIMNIKYVMLHKCYTSVACLVRLFDGPEMTTCIFLKLKLFNYGCNDF